MQIETSRVINFLLAGFFVGIILHSFFDISIYVIFAIALSMFAIMFFVFYKKQKTNPRIFFVLALSLGVIFGLMRYSGDVNKTSPLKNFVDTNGVYEVVVDRDPIKKANSISFDAKVLNVGGEKINDEKLIRVKAYVSDEIKYGDVLRLVGRVENPQTFETGVGRVFDYPTYLSARRVGYVMNNPKIAIQSENFGNVIMIKLFAFKHAFTEGLGRVVGEPERSLATGMLIGEQSGLPKDVSVSMRNAGLVHIVVLSGFNITIIAFGAMILFWWAGKRLRLLAGALASILFVLMSGAESASVRAGIMTLIGLFAQAVYRPYDIARGLVIAAGMMVLINPQILVFDISFQLSFLATLGLFVGSPIIAKYLHFITERGGVREIVSATLSTQIAVSPLILYTMGQFSLVALPANLIVLPLVPFAMLTSGVAGLVEFVNHTLAIPFGIVAAIILKIILLTSTFFGNLPFAVLTSPPFPAFVMVLMYVGLILIVWRLNKKESGAP